MSDEAITQIPVDVQVKVDHKLPFKIKTLEDGVEVTPTELPVITLSDDTPATIAEDGVGGYFFVPADESTGAIVQVRAKWGSGDDAVFGDFTVEIVAADIIVTPPVRTITFEFGEPVPK